MEIKRPGPGSGGLKREREGWVVVEKMKEKEGKNLKNLPGTPVHQQFFTSFSLFPPPPPPAIHCLSCLYSFPFPFSFIKGEISKISIFALFHFSLFSSSNLIPSLSPSITLFTRCISSLYTLLLGLHPNLKFDIFPHFSHFALFSYPPSIYNPTITLIL